jgi:hypothetical protein
MPMAWLTVFAVVVTSAAFALQLRRVRSELDALRGQLEVMGRDRDAARARMSEAIDQVKFLRELLLIYETDLAEFARMRGRILQPTQLQAGSR